MVMPNDVFQGERRPPHLFYKGNGVPHAKREFKIYGATGSTTRLRKKEICHARQKL
jgi:hypothetical protein